jgi:hypothetical protein
MLDLTAHGLWPEPAPQPVESEQGTGYVGRRHPVCVARTKIAGEVHNRPHVLTTVEFANVLDDYFGFNPHAACMSLEPLLAHERRSSRMPTRLIGF